MPKRNRLKRNETGYLRKVVFAKGDIGEIIKTGGSFATMKTRNGTKKVISITDIKAVKRKDGSWRKIKG